MKPQTLMSHMLGGGGEGGTFQSDALTPSSSCDEDDCLVQNKCPHFDIDSFKQESLGPNTAVSMSVHAVDVSRRINLC